jgi:hypothetical protein
MEAARQSLRVATRRRKNTEVPRLQTLAKFYPDVKVEFMSKGESTDHLPVFCDGYAGDVPSHTLALAMAKAQQTGMPAGNTLFSPDILKARTEGMTEKEIQEYFQAMFDSPEFTNDGRATLSSKKTKPLVGGARTLEDILRVYVPYTIPLLELIRFLNQDRLALSQKDVMILLLRNVYGGHPVSLLLQQHLDEKRVRIANIPASIVIGWISRTPVRSVSYRNLDDPLLNLANLSEYRIRFLVLGALLYAITDFLYMFQRAISNLEDNVAKTMMHALNPRAMEMGPEDQRYELLGIYNEIATVCFSALLTNRDLVSNTRMERRSLVYKVSGDDLQSNLEKVKSLYISATPESSPRRIFDSAFVCYINNARTRTFEFCSPDVPQLATYCFQILERFGLQHRSGPVEFAIIPRETRLVYEVAPHGAERINVQQIVPDYKYDAGGRMGGDPRRTTTNYLYMYDQYHPYLDRGIDVNFLTCAIMSQAAYLPTRAIPTLFRQTSAIRYLGGFREDPLWKLPGGESQKHTVHVWYKNYRHPTTRENITNLYICFRGSHTSKDWQEIDFGIMQNTAQFYDERVRDFPSLFQEILVELSRYVRFSTQLYLFSTGHSLGGFLALMLSYYSQSGIIRDYRFVVDDRTMTYSIPTPYIKPVVFNPFCGPKGKPRTLTAIETCLTYLPHGYVFRVGEFAPGMILTFHDNASEIFCPEFNIKVNLHVYQVKPVMNFGTFCGKSAIKSYHHMYQFLGSLWIHLQFLGNRFTVSRCPIQPVQIMVRNGFNEPAVPCRHPKDRYSILHIPEPTAPILTNAGIGEQDLAPVGIAVEEVVPAMEPAVVGGRTRRRHRTSTRGRRPFRSTRKV